MSLIPQHSSSLPADQRHNAKWVHAQESWNKAALVM